MDLVLTLRDPSIMYSYYAAAGLDAETAKRSPLFLTSRPEFRASAVGRRHETKARVYLSSILSSCRRPARGRTRIELDPITRFLPEGLT